MTAWRAGLKLVADQYLDDLAAKGFPKARAAYDALSTRLRQ
jgi:hypothetical protein